uniref:Kinesin-like ATPase n=1 Tax=Panulirus argus virus 1 TaxID=380624 RepID=A0A6G9HDP9_9VIRU|nr:kinesin-like ATPase [Panulirus argus virus 1]
MIIVDDDEKKGTDFLETLTENAVALLKGDVYALFHNCVLLTVQVITHEFTNIRTLNEWDAVLKKVDERHRAFTALAHKLQIDPEDEIFQLLENLRVKLHTTVVDNDLFYAKKEMETFLDALVGDIARYVVSRENLYDSERFLKNIEWDPEKPFTMQHLYRKITGNVASELNDVLRSIATIIEEELDIIDGGDGGGDGGGEEINKIRKSLNDALRDIEENGGGRISGVTKNQLLNTVKYGIRLLVNKHSKRLYLNEDDPEPIKDETCGSYSVLDNMCINPNLIYKFIALYEFYKNKLRLGDVEAQFKNLQYENALDVCRASTYNVYYENVYNIMLEALLYFESEPECSRIRKNLYFYLFMVIRRLMSEVFANPFAVGTSTSTFPSSGGGDGDDVLHEDSKDYVKKLKEGSLILNNNRFAGRPPIINVAAIAKRFAKTDKILTNDALELYDKYKAQFIAEVGKYMESAYEMLNADARKSCPRDAGNDAVNSPLFTDRSIYTTLAEMLQKMKSRMDDDDDEEEEKPEIDGILSAILNMENKYVKYITENELLPPTIKAAAEGGGSDDDDDDVDDDDRILQYNRVVDKLKREWDNFKYHTIGYDKSLLGKTRRDNGRLISILNEMVDGEEDVGGLLATFRRIMLTDVWKDNDKLSDDVKQLKKSVTNAKKELTDLANDKIKALIQNGNFSDAVKAKLLRYIENDARIKHNLELIAEKKVEPVVMESLLNGRGEEEARRLAKTEGERDALLERVNALETVQARYRTIQEMLKNDTNDTELITNISNLLDQVKRDEEQIATYETDIRKLTRTVDALQTRLHDKMEHDDGTVERIKADYEDAVEKHREETENLRSVHRALTQKYDALEREKNALHERYERLDDAVNECKKDKSRLKETLSLVSSLEEQLSENTVNENECKKELSEVNQKMVDITDSLSRVEKEMDEKTDQLHAARETDLERYSKETEALKREANDLRENVEYLKRDARDNLNKIARLYGDVDNVKTYEDLIDAINDHNEARRRATETAANENDRVLDILAKHNVDGGTNGLSELLERTEKTNRQLESIYKNITTDLCTVFNRYDVASVMCSSAPAAAKEEEDDGGGGGIAHHLSLLQTSALPQLVSLLKEKEKNADAIERASKDRERELAELKTNLAEKDVQCETLRRTYDNVVREFNNDSNANKGKLKELNDEITSLRNAKKEMETRNRQSKDSDGDRIKNLNEKLRLLEQVKTKLNDDVQRHSKEYQKANGEIKRLQNENKALAEKQTSIVEALRKKGIDVDTLRSQLESLVDNKGALERDIVELNNLNKELVERHEAGLSALKEEYDQQLLAKEKLIEDLNAKLEGMDAKLKNTNVQFSDLQRELYSYQRYKEETERSNLEMKARLHSKETGYENEIERSRKLNGEIIKLKSIIHNLETTNSFLKESVDDLKAKNETLDKNIEILGNLQTQNRHLTREKNKLLRELKESEFVKAEHDKFIKELEMFIANVSEYKYNAQENEELINVLKVVEDQFNKLKAQNVDYANLVQSYEQRLATYKKELTAPPDESVLNALSAKYAQAQKRYNENVNRLTREVEKCKNELSDVDKTLKNAYNAKDEMRREWESVRRENERLRKECHNVQFKMDSLKHEGIVPENCEEHLQRAHETRLKMFGNNIRELVAKLEEKKRVLDKHGGKGGAAMAAVLAKLRKSKVNVSSALALPKNCAEYANAVVILNDIDTKYKAVDEYITDVYDAYSDLFQLGRVYVRMKPPVSSGKYEYDTRNPVVEIIPGKTPFDKNGIVVNDRRFNIDSYFDENVTNKDIFATIESTLTAIKKHKTVFVIVYGQTGSGKSYTITGSGNDKGLLSYVYAYARSLSDDTIVRIYGLYNNNIYDLTKIHNGVLTSDSKPPAAAIVNNVTDCKTLKNTPYPELETLLQRGTILRKTKFNDRSSRAHTFIDIHLPKLRASLVLVDLCGNEKTSALADVPVVKSESAYINTSLMEVSTHLLQRFREGARPMLSGKLKVVFDYYMRNSDVKINTIFHIHKYLTNNNSVNNTIITSTIMTLQRANDISTV